ASLSPIGREAGAEGEDLCAQGGALGRVDHGDVAREAEGGGQDVAGVAPALAGRAVLVDLVEERAEAAQLGAHDGRALVDDDAGDLLPAALAYDADLVGVDGEALGGDDLAQEGEGGADAGCGVE